MFTRVVEPCASLVLLPSLGTTARVWDDALAEMNDLSIDVLQFDLPGHGGAADRVGFDIDDLADAVARCVSVVVAPGCPIVVAGVSMGGAIALEIARRHPALVDGFAVFGAALRFGSSAGWAAIIDRVEAAQTPGFDRDGTRAGWFTPEFSGGAGAARSAQILNELAAVDPVGYIHCCQALDRYDGSLAATPITVRGIAVAGASDGVVLAPQTKRITAVGTDIEYREIEGAHLAIIEDARGAAGVLRELISHAAE